MCCDGASAACHAWGHAGRGGVTGRLPALCCHRRRHRSFTKRIFIPLPDADTREALFRKTLKIVQVESDVDFKSLADRTVGYNCSDVVQIAKDAIVGPLREISARMKAEGVPVTSMIEWTTSHGVKPNAVGARHLEDALRRIKSAVPKDAEAKMREWEAEAGSM